MLRYKGFHATVQYCINLQIYQAEVINAEDRLVFGASNFIDLQPLMEKAVDEYLTYQIWCESLVGTAVPA